MPFNNRQLGCMAHARTPIMNMFKLLKSGLTKTGPTRLAPMLMIYNTDFHAPFVAVDGTGDGSDGLMVMGCELGLSLSSSNPLPVRPYILLS